ncbi:MAG: hypothetical protein ACRCS6_13260 [Turicibacter sp.]
MKRDKLFSLNPIVVVVILGIAIAIANYQLKEESRKVSVVDESKSVVYAQGSLMNSAKEYLVDHIYRGDKYEPLVEWLVNLDSRILVFLNDYHIFIRTIPDIGESTSFNKETNEMIFPYSDELDLNEYFGLSFYFQLGQAIYENIEDKSCFDDVDVMYQQALTNPEVEISNSVDYFATRVTLFYSDLPLLQSQIDTHNDVIKVLEAVGLL